jgi:hypothetical protein
MAATTFYTKDGTYCSPDQIFYFYDPSDVYSCKVINDVLYNKCKEALKDPWINVNIAINKFLTYGFKPWSVWSYIKKHCFK